MKTNEDMPLTHSEIECENFLAAAAVLYIPFQKNLDRCVGSYNKLLMRGLSF